MKPEPLPLKRILALAGRVYARLMDMLENEPGEAEIWQEVVRLGDQAASVEGGLESWYGATVDELLIEEQLSVDEATRHRLLNEVHRAWSQAANQQLKRSGGDFSPDPKAARFPKWEPHPNARSGPTLTALFDLWKKGHLREGKAAGTVKIYEHKKKVLAEYLGHEDVSRITPQDISSWCDHLRHEKERAAKTVRDKHLAAIKAIFNLAVSKFVISINPTDKVVVKVAKKRRGRSKGFTDGEAKQILEWASRAEQSNSGMSRENKLACRWVPWICAYTGARVGEITQLRKEDLSDEDGIPMITITPEAGTVKSGHYRKVPVHPHLQEIGLLDFMRIAKPGYLFHSGGTSQNEATKLSVNARDKVRNWVRNTVGVADPRVQPNHGWRHRFKTQARNAKIEVEYRDAIQGHASRTAGEDYGEYSAQALYREICKLPRIGVEEPI